MSSPTRDGAPVRVAVPRHCGEDAGAPAEVLSTADGPRLPGLAPDLPSLVRATVDRVPDAEAVVDLASGLRLSYAQLWEAAARVAGGLAADGVRPGDRVAIRLPNGAAWCTAFLGASLAGAVPVPVNTRLAAAEVAFLVEDSGAAAVLDDPARLPDAAPPARAAAPRTGGDGGAESLAAMFYTSGTTGRPKGAMLSHRALLAAAEQCRRGLRLAADDPTRSLVAAPLFHILACGMQWIPALAAGGAVVIMPAFEVTGWLRTVREERIDLLNGVPAMFWQALRHPDFATLDTSGVRRISYGAAPTPPSQVRALLAAFPAARLAPGYGLTEAACVTGLEHEDAVGHADSVGTPVVATDIALLGPEADAGVGQLLVRGPQVMSGYWRRPEATAEALADGWLHTGDVVRVDEAGRIRILDRRTDLINRGGENVYSVEVETALSAYADVAEVAVVGVPDPMMGQKVGAVVVPRPGRPFDPRGLVAFASGVLADFKVPQYVAVRDDPLPRNPGGKVDKALLRTSTDWGSPLR